MKLDKILTQALRKTSLQTEIRRNANSQFDNCHSQEMLQEIDGELTA